MPRLFWSCGSLFSASLLTRNVVKRSIFHGMNTYCKISYTDYFLTKAESHAKRTTILSVAASSGFKLLFLLLRLSHIFFGSGIVPLFPRSILFLFCENILYNICVLCEFQIFF